ncbi:MAG TPA: hypothetical protein QKA14_00980, partial [Candidatus Megaira endosymbiont of Hartmannula sinica]|nr:hypothetical protein [Candidatus Megaera endosymbiont of Hartmannula sinica]
YIPTITYRIFFYKILMKPLVISIMSFCAFAYININKRNINQSIRLFFGIINGVFIYLFIEITPKILAYNNIYLSIANLIPISITLLIYIFIVFLQKQR